MAAGVANHPAAMQAEAEAERLRAVWNGEEARTKQEQSKVGRSDKDD